MQTSPCPPATRPWVSRAQQSRADSYRREPSHGPGCIQPTHLGPAAAPSPAWPGRRICQSLSLRCEGGAKGGVEDGATGWDSWVQEDPPSNPTGLHRAGPGLRFPQKHWHPRPHTLLVNAWVGSVWFRQTYVTAQWEPSGDVSCPFSGWCLFPPGCCAAMGRCFGNHSFNL